MVLTTDTEAFKATKMATVALRLDEATRTALGAQLNISNDEWRDRFFDVAADALADAVFREDPEILYSEMRHYSTKLVQAGRWDNLIDTFEKLHQRVTQKQRASASSGGQSVDPDEITRQFFGWEVIETAFSVLRQTPSPDEKNSHARINATLISALSVIAGDKVMDAVNLANRLPEGDLRELALGYVERNIDGSQQTITDLLNDLDPSLAQRMLALVSKSLGGAAVDMLNPLLMSPNPALRCEATALLAQSPAELGKQLVRLLGSRDPHLRSAALTTMLRHEVKQAGPGLVGVIEEVGFAQRPGRDQRQMFDTLYALNPPRAEKLLTAIVKQHGMLADEALDRVRIIAAEALGAQADSVNPLDALTDATKMRPWNTQALRSASDSALAAISDRLRHAREARG